MDMTAHNNSIVDDEKRIQYTYGYLLVNLVYANSYLCSFHCVTTTTDKYFIKFSLKLSKYMVLDFLCHII